MKNNTSRFSKLILTCVPFLLLGTTLVNAEETSTSSSEAISTTTDSLNIEKIAETLSSEEVTTTSTSEDETETQEVKTTIPELTFESNKIEGKKGNKGKLKLNKVDGVTLTGTFKPVKSDFVSIDKEGNWEILSNDTSVTTDSIILEYTFSKNDEEKLKDIYTEQKFDETIKTEKVTFEIAKKEVADISLALSTEIFKGSEGTFEVKTKDGTVVTGDFDKLSSNDLTISKIEGKNEFQYKIANEETFELKETLIFTLDDASIAALEKENADKEVPTKYEIKFAQKNIVITFKNKNITTTVGGVGRLDPANYGDIVISGTFVPLTNNNVISIDEKGNWKALSVTSGTGILTPGFNVDPAVVTELEKAYPDFNLNITNSTVPVTITQSTSTSDKTYAPTAKSNLPQTGEEKLRFFSIIGVLLIGAVAVIFFVKRKKDSTK